MCTLIKPYGPIFCDTGVVLYGFISTFMGKSLEQRQRCACTKLGLQNLYISFILVDFISECTLTNRGGGLNVAFFLKNTFQMQPIFLDSFCRYIDGSSGDTKFSLKPVSQFYYKLVISYKMINLFVIKQKKILFVIVKQIKKVLQFSLKHACLAPVVPIHVCVHLQLTCIHVSI